jgi:hypothetical protein
MMARQAPVSVAVMRRWELHDPGRSCLLDVITHYVTSVLRLKLIVEVV